MSQQFDQLRERLLRAGIAPRHVGRYIAELRDHFDDLVREETANGLKRDEAENTARTRIGGNDALAAVMLVRPELRSLTSRHLLGQWRGRGFPLMLLTGSRLMRHHWLSQSFYVSSASGSAWRPVGSCWGWLSSASLEDFMRSV